jgi:4-aminobutyrate aminotransferase-like enzyme/Ser/Thr protein kinase RdoA (MazF antagonist)
MQKNTAGSEPPLFNFFDHVALPTPKLTIAEVRSLLLEHFDLDFELRPLGSQQDQNFLVTSHGSLEPLGVLKISNPVFSRLELELQEVVAERLAEDNPDLRVARVATLNGQRVKGWFDTTQGRLHLCLLDYIDGVTLAGGRYLAPAVIERMGELAGRVSRSLASVSHPGAARTLQWDLRHAKRVVDEIGAANLGARGGDTIAPATDEAWQVIEALATQLPRQLGHFDLTDDNLVGACGDTPSPDGIIDFGDVTDSWAIAELAVTISSMLHHDGAEPRSVLPAVKAFDAIRPLSDAELTALWPLVVLRGATGVVSGQHQAVIDVKNEYVEDSLDSDWRIFEQAASLPLDVMTGLFRHVLERPAAPLCDTSGYGQIVDLGAEKVATLDASTTSEVNDNGGWRDVNSLERVALGLLDSGAAAAVLPFNSIVLTGSPILSPTEPRTVTTETSIWSSTERTVLAPTSGEVRTVEDAIEFWFDDVVLRLSGARPATTESEVGEGRAIAVLRARSRVRIQLRAARSSAIPSLVSAGYAPGWLSVVADPARLLGLPESIAPRPNDLLERRNRVLARVQDHYYETPPQIERGWKEHLVDVNGRVYLDMVNNVTSVGHAHPRIAAAASRQLRLLNTNSRFNYEAITTFAEKLVATLPKELSTVFLVNSGSEATDLAIRLAMAATDRRDIVAMRESYHGWTYASDAVSTSIADNPNALDTRPDWVHTVDAANSYRGKHRGKEAHRYATEAVEQIDMLGAVGIAVAGFISESFFGNAGGVPLPDGYLAAVYGAIRAGGGLAIADEVQVGYGRLGHWFWGFEQQGVTPDIVTVAKSIGNGHPIGAVITSQAVAERFRSQGYFFSSTGGSPVSCAIASTVLDIIREERLQANAATVGTHLKQRLEALGVRHELIGAVHGSGLYMGVEFVQDRETLEPATAQTAAICSRLLELGVIMQPTGDHNNVLKIKPPLCIDQTSVDYFAEMLDRVLTEGW